MADSQDTIALPETRAALEQLVEAAIARLDEMDGDPDDEPNLGAPKGSEPSGADVGRWMAEQLARLNGESARGELYRDRSQSQESWAAGGDVGEREDVSEGEGECCEGEGEQDDREPEEADWDHDSENCGTVAYWVIRECRAQMGLLDPMSHQKAQRAKTEVCQAAIENLRTIQRRKGRQPVQPLQVVSGAIVR